MNVSIYGKILVKNNKVIVVTQRKLSYVGTLTNDRHTIHTEHVVLWL